MAHRTPSPFDRLRPLRTDGDEDDRHAGVLLDRRDVPSRVLRQGAERADAVDRLDPTRERVVDGRRPRESRTARWPDLDPPAVDVVCDADADRLEPREDVELVEHDAADAVDGHGIAQRDRVEPADAPRPPGDCPDLMTACRDPGADLVVQLGRVRTGPDP